MLTAFFSGLFGLLSGSIPKAFEFFQKRQENSHELQIREFEMKFRQLDHQLAMERIKAEGQIKIDESYYAAVTAQGQATREYMADLIKSMNTPTGVPWIDKLNAVIRPLTAAFVLVCFFGTLIAWIGGAPVNSAFGVQLGALFVELTQGVIFFILGYRSIPKPAALRTA